MHPVAGQLQERFALPTECVSVVADDEELLQWVRSRLPAADATGGRCRSFRLGLDGDQWMLHEDGWAPVFHGTRDAVAIRLLERLNELACFTNPVVTVHSGLVADGAGRGIWIPAQSGGGKSTLTAQLTSSGLRYATDEAVTVSAGGELTGWPKWIGLKRGSHEVLAALAPDRDEAIDGGDRWMVPPGAVGVVVRSPVRPAVVAFPRHRRGGCEIEEISRAEALAEIVPQAFNLRRLGRAGIDALASAVRRSHSCLRISYGDGWEAAEQLKDRLTSAPDT